MRAGSRGSGFGSRDWGSGFGVRESGFRIRDFGISDFGFRISDSDSEFRICIKQHHPHPTLPLKGRASEQCAVAHFVVRGNAAKALPFERLKLRRRKSPPLQGEGWVGMVLKLHGCRHESMTATQ